MPNNLKNNKFYNSFIKKAGKLKWLEILGIAIFFFILLVAFLFITRRRTDIVVTIRLLESNNAPTMYNFPRQMFIENLKKGLKEKDESGNTVAEVLDVYRYPSSNVNQDVFVTLKISSVYNRTTGQYSYDNLPLLIGDFRTFRLQDILLNGLVIEVNSGNQPREQKKFTITAFLDPEDNDNPDQPGQFTVLNGVYVDGIRNYLADQIKPGLSMVDSNDTTIATITSVNKTAGKVMFIQNGNYITANDPNRKHVEITVEVLGEKIGDSYYFQKEGVLRVGEKLWLTFAKIKLLPTITSIE